jgi:xanthine/uracil/vitamin C permease (AzgA family)
MLKLIPNVIGMIFVVTLSSSLDVTAIEIELQQQQQQQQQPKQIQQRPQNSEQDESIVSPPPPLLSSLNYNSELRMIGISNIISGCFGGYTGSYIFSQSIFSLRAGIRSRLAGYVLAFNEFLIFVLPIPILSYVPNFLFASLLIMICIDLMIEWLWDVRHRLTHVEYILCLSTFVLIQTFNVEYGIIGGILLYVLTEQVLLRWGINHKTKLANSTMPTFDEKEVADLLLEGECHIGSDRQANEFNDIRKFHE